MRMRTKRTAFALRGTLVILIISLSVYTNTNVDDDDARLNAPGFSTADAV